MVCTPQSNWCVHCLAFMTHFSQRKMKKCAQPLELVPSPGEQFCLHEWNYTVKTEPFHPLTSVVCNHQWMLGSASWINMLWCGWPWPTSVELPIIVLLGGKTEGIAFDKKNGKNCYMPHHLNSSSPLLLFWICLPRQLCFLFVLLALAPKQWAVFFSVCIVCVGIQAAGKRSYLRRYSSMTKEMRPSHRIDVLSDALHYYGWKSAGNMSMSTPSVLPYSTSTSMLTQINSWQKDYHVQKMQKEAAEKLKDVIQESPGSDMLYNDCKYYIIIANLCCTLQFLLQKM